MALLCGQVFSRRADIWFYEPIIKKIVLINGMWSRRTSGAEVVLRRQKLTRVSRGVALLKAALSAPLSDRAGRLPDIADCLRLKLSSITSCFQ